MASLLPALKNGFMRVEKRKDIIVLAFYFGIDVPLNFSSLYSNEEAMQGMQLANASCI
jgi:hypothetical protein